MQIIYDMKKIPKTSNGDVPVVVQDQSTFPLIRYFLETVSSFELAEDTDKSGSSAESLIYSFEAGADHGILANNSITFYDQSTDRTFYAEVISVSDNTIELDRPIDSVFHSDTTICNIVSKEMKVDGSSVPKIFSIRSGLVPTDTMGFHLQIICTSEPSGELFGSGAALTKGIVFRILSENSSKVLGSLKYNMQLKHFGSSVEYTDKAGGTNWSVDISMKIREMWGVVLRSEKNVILEIIIQDNLDRADIVSVTSGIFGHYTEGE